MLYIDNYAAFFVLELIGNTGVSMWQTTSQVVIADMSTPENRGRAVAMRNSSLRLGQLIGPGLGGLIAVTWGLPQVFVVNGVSKFLVMFITLYMIGETRPTRTPKPATERTSLRADLLPIVFSRAFIALGLTTIAAALIGQTIVQVMFPIASKVEGGLIESEIGFLISIAGVITLLCSFPNGMLVDRFGRKMSLVPGLLIAAVAAVLLSMMADFSGALLGMAVLGVAIAMTMGSTQAFAMDLAPGGQARRVHRRLVGVPEFRLRDGPAGHGRRRGSLGVRDGIHRSRRLPDGRRAGDGVVRAGDAPTPPPGGGNVLRHTRPGVASTPTQRRAVRSEVQGDGGEHLLDVGPLLRQSLFVRVVDERVQHRLVRLHPVGVRVVAEHCPRLPHVVVAENEVGRHPRGQRAHGELFGLNERVVQVQRHPGVLAVDVAPDHVGVVGGDEPVLLEEPRPLRDAVREERLDLAQVALAPDAPRAVDEVRPLARRARRQPPG